MPINAVSSHVHKYPVTSGQELFSQNTTKSPEYQNIFQCIRKSARSVAADTEILFEGDDIKSVVWVLEGWLAESKVMDDGRRQLIDIVLPFDIVMSKNADGFTSPYGLTALTDCVIAPYPYADFLRQREMCGDFDLLIKTLRAAADARQGEVMLRLGQGTACERVAYILLELFVRLEAIGQIRDGAFALPITQKDIGDFAGLTSVHVCRMFRKLAKEGAIENLDHEIIVRDIDKLAEISKTDYHYLKEAVLPPVDLKIG